MGVNGHWRRICLSLVATVFPAGAVCAAEPGSLGELWIVDLFRKGGPVMWPILVCSIFAVAICIERLINLRRSKIIHPEFLMEVRAHWQEREYGKALEVCKQHRVAMARIVRAGLLRANMGVLEVERAVEGAGNHESMLLMANLRGLGVIANVSPMLGLLGTVTGMIRTFNVMSTHGVGNPTLMATGISEALIATAAGLVVGIPALAAYFYFRGRVDGIIFEMEEVSIKFLEEITSNIAREQYEEFR